ncbi:phosphate system positive regulatory protein pho81 [Malassezia brasiliensis]|uniref:Phosphate system positive regulatory protein pho81 n=1 Tax=Malassezia brasiliensis TaxID=1821822 RepID=A0AAF0DR34_9BASI|nr:phosphate system positive regulatory protein pho81 [Malassezia brasiliensis]
MKIINSLEKGRLGDAALFATSVRPPSDAPSDQLPLAADSPASELQIHKAAFFFKLERELEKINAFYLQKESDLRARLTTLISKKRHLIASATGHAHPDSEHTGQVAISKDSPSFVALLEGFHYFEKDLAKLQQFIEINATGFRKILKKWDKRSKSQTKELYLARQVDAQPCFNREFIAEMSDLAAASVLQLESLAEGHELPASSNQNEAAILKGALPYTATNIPGSIFLHATNTPTGSDALVFDSERRMDFEAERDSSTDKGFLHEIGEQINAAVHESRTDDAKQLLADARRETWADMQAALGDTAARDDKLDPQAPVASGLEHQVWRALATASAPAIHAAIVAELPNYAFVDDINARTTLHISTLANQLELVKACVEHGVPVRSCDVYGREALAYAAMHGHKDICHYLLSLPASRESAHGVDAASLVDAVDLDGFSPLIHAVVRGHTEIVRILLDHKASVGSAPRGKTESSDLSPLALAAEGGFVDITRLLLNRGAKIEPNTEGLLPQALAARAGHVECLRVLLDAGVEVDAAEKGTLWTPLFFAAEAGHMTCVHLLLDRGASLAHVDEKGRHAVFYAAWNGWMACTRLLLDTARAQAPTPTPVSGSLVSPAALKPSSEGNGGMDMDMDGDADGIPSLYLPPPIIPFRTYGHNYLDKRSLLTISLSNKSIVLHKRPVPDRFELFAGHTSSLKLVLTPRSVEPSAEAGIPHTLILPMADERDDITFQIENLDQFHLEWELFPPFGSSRIAKTALLPDMLGTLPNRGMLQLPLFDWHLNVVGHIDVAVECVRPFGSVQLEIGGRVETYWKSTLPSSNQPISHSPASSSERRVTGLSHLAAGTVRPAAVPTTRSDVPRAPEAPLSESTSYVTASSLSGDYLRVVVRYTSDMEPVACVKRTLPLPVWAPLVSQVTKREFLEIAAQTGRKWDVQDAEAWTMADWSNQLADALVPLDTLLATVPPTVGLALEVHLDTASGAGTAPVSVNDCVDATLHAVYDAADRSRGQSRKLFFSSASPGVCVALNWKQPNYAVFFVLETTLAHDAAVAQLPAKADPRQSSIAEGVRFAKGNNLLGVMANTELLECVPEMVPSIKAAGLVLITLSRPTTNVLAPIESSLLLSAPAIPYEGAFDGYIHDNVIQCTK